MAGRTGPLIRQTAFWDASALVSLFVLQKATSRAAALYQTFDVVAWWATRVEIASALARLVRMGELKPGDSAKALKAVKVSSESWFVVQPSTGLLENAERLVNHHDLRAADALQLAAALEWCDHLPAGRVFLATDQKLKRAALLSGFDVSPL